MHKKASFPDSWERGKTYKLDKKSGVRLDIWRSCYGSTVLSNSHAAGVNPALLGRPFIRLVMSIRYVRLLLPCGGEYRVEVKRVFSFSPT